MVYGRYGVAEMVDRHPRLEKAAARVHRTVRQFPLVAYLLRGIVVRPAAAR